MIPGRHPFEELETALLRVAVRAPPSLLDQLWDEGGIRRAAARVLPDEHSQLVLVIDQFEELYTLSDPATAARFVAAVVDAVTDATSRIRVIVTLRADFYDRPLDHRELGQLLRTGTEVVTPMTTAELERAITEPARARGVEFDLSVVTAMIADVADRPGALPLLEYALTELFERSTGPTITHATYAAIGGVSGALGDRAESLYVSFDADAREAIRQLFLRLVTLGEGSEDTRRRALLSELTSLEGAGRHIESVVETFGRHRLLSFDRDPLSRTPTVEISHEALLREWPRLRKWIEAGRADVRAQRRLGVAAAEWLERDEDPDFVFTGAQLVPYDGWLHSAPVELTASERRFLEAGLAAQRRHETDQRQRARRETQLRRRSRLLVALAVVTAVVLALGAFAVVQRQRANDLADRLARAERARQLTSDSVPLSREDPPLAAMLAIEAARATADSGTVSAPTVDAIHAAIQGARAQYPVGNETPTTVRDQVGASSGVFLMPPDDLIAFAQTLARPAFSESECARFFPSVPCPDPTAPLPTGLAIDGSYAETRGAQPLAGTTVTVSGGAPSDEQLAANDPISDRTGIEIVYVPSSEVTEDAVRGGRAADIVIGDTPAVLWALASEGHLMDVTRYLDRNELRDAFGDYLVELTTVAPDGTSPAASGGVYGLWVALYHESLIWHPSPELAEAGYAVPTTWDELIDLSDRLVADGQTPWCLGIGDVGATGWLATDWVETVLLRSQGPEFYDQWVHHEIPFNHPAVVDAARHVGELVFTEGYVQGGPSSVVTQPFQEAARSVGAKPQGCWLLPQGSSVPTLNPTLIAGGNIDAFDLAVDPRYAATIVGHGDLIAATSDRPEVRAVMTALASAEHHVRGAELGLGLSPLRAVDPALYPTATDQWIGEVTRQALDTGNWRFDASAMMPLDVSGAFVSGMTRYFLRGPDSLEGIMARIEAQWVAVEQGTD